ncbi:hypothetical protein [Helicobacter sp. T3_23-1056]
MSKPHIITQLHNIFANCINFCKHTHHNAWYDKHSSLQANATLSKVTFA